MRKALPTLGVVSAGLLLAGSPAHAVGTTMVSTNNTGIANGVGVNLPVQAPINICGNGVGVLGNASASCVGGATANYGKGGSGGNVSMTASGNTGLLNGVNANALLQIPVNLCGNAIGILGTASASCTKSGATANAFNGPSGHHTMHPPMHYHPMMPPVMPGPMPGSMPGSITHNALPAKALPTVNHKPAAAHVHPKVAPIRVHRKEAGLLGNLLAPVTELLGHPGGHYGHGSGMCGNVSQTANGNTGAANGVNVNASIQAPINFSGNGIGVLGTGIGSSQGGATANFC